MTPEEQTPIDKEKINGEKKSRKNWLKRFGILGFWFFFAKGMLWIVAGIATYYGFAGC